MTRKPITPDSDSSSGGVDLRRPTRDEPPQASAIEDRSLHEPDDTIRGLPDYSQQNYDYILDWSRLWGMLTVTFWQLPTGKSAVDTGYFPVH